MADPRLIAALLGRGVQQAKASFGPAPLLPPFLQGMGGPALHGPSPGYREEMDVPPEWQFNKRPGIANPVGGRGTGPLFDVNGAGFDFTSPR